MHKLKAFYAGLILAAVVLSACGATQSAAMPTPAPTQRIDFQSTDGTPLVGTFWPPRQSLAPGIILMHMAGARKESWQYLPDALQNLGEGQRAYAVFAFDFRGHGESQGNQDDRAGMLEDAKAALSTFRTLEGVDPGRIVLIGASVGADAAVDVCGEGCIGSISLSPGGYLGIEYASALSAMAAKPVLCVASESDEQPAQTCRNGEQLDLTDYRIQLYKGGFHGTEMLGISDQQPLLTDLIVEWLAGHVP